MQIPKKRFENTLMYKEDFMLHIQKKYFISYLKVQIHCFLLLKMFKIMD